MKYVGLYCTKLAAKTGRTQRTLNAVRHRRSRAQIDFEAASLREQWPYAPLFVTEEYGPPVAVVEPCDQVQQLLLGATKIGAIGKEGDRTHFCPYASTACKSTSRSACAAGDWSCTCEIVKRYLPEELGSMSSTNSKSTLQSAPINKRVSLAISSSSRVS